MVFIAKRGSKVKFSFGIVNGELPRAVVDHRQAASTPQFAGL
jgi:hypothetical protein